MNEQEVFPAHKVLKAMSGSQSEQDWALAELQKEQYPLFVYWFKRQLLSDVHEFSEDESEDLAMNLLIKIFEAAPTYRGSEGFLDLSAFSFMHIIKKNLWTDYQRKVTGTGKIKRTHIPYDTIGNTEDDEPADQFLQKGGLPSLEEELAVNPAKLTMPGELTATDCVGLGLSEFRADHEVNEFYLRMFMNGNSMATIAEQRDSTKGSTKQYISECRKKAAAYIEHCLEFLEPLREYE